jgi:hypothetical protein
LQLRLMYPHLQDNQSRDTDSSSQSTFLTVPASPTLSLTQQCATTWAPF